MAKFRHFGKIIQIFVLCLEGLFIVWQTFEPTLAKLLRFV